MLEDRVQGLNSVTCGIFQLHFYENLFTPDENSKTIDKKWLNKRTIEILDDQDKNEDIVRQYADKNKIIVH